MDNKKTDGDRKLAPCRCHFDDEPILMPRSYQSQLKWLLYWIDHRTPEDKEKLGQFVPENYERTSYRIRQLWYKVHPDVVDKRSEKKAKLALKAQRKAGIENPSQEELERKAIWRGKQSKLPTANIGCIMVHKGIEG